MRRSYLPALVILAGLCLILAGCGGGGGGTWTGIEGYVTEGRGDSACAGIAVNLYEGAEIPGTYIPSAPTLADSVVTDSAGYYRFEDLQTGATYLVEVAPAGDHPGARHQHLIIEAEEDHVRADLIVRPPFPAAQPAGLPFIESVTADGSLLQAGRILTGQIDLAVKAQAAGAGLPIKEIIVKFGHLSNGSNIVVDNGDEVATFAWDTTKHGDGASFLYVITYDLNDNAAIVSIPIVIDSNQSGAAPAAPEIVRVEAWTFAEPYGIKAPARTFTLPPLKVYRDGKPIYLPSPGSLAAGARAISGSASAMVHIQVKPTGDATSYRIYRRAGTTGSFVSIGERGNEARWYEDAYRVVGHTKFNALWFNDLDPALAVNAEYYYRVAAVNAGGETDSGHTYHVKILPKFTAALSSPADNAKIDLDADPTPAFSWTAAGGMNDISYASFIIYVLNKNDEPGGFSWCRWVNGQTSLEYGDVIDGGDSGDDEDLVTPKPLVHGAIYEWDLYYATSASQFTDSNFGESYAANFSYPRVDNGSTNGGFIFSTVP